MSRPLTPEDVLRDGIYRVHRIRLEPDGARWECLGSYRLDGLVFRVVKDPAGWIARLAPDGEPLDAQGQRRLWVLCCHSSYFEVERCKDETQEAQGKEA